MHALKRFTQCGSLTMLFAVFIVLFGVSSTALTTFGKAPPAPAPPPPGTVFRFTFSHSSLRNHFSSRIKCVPKLYQSMNHRLIFNESHRRGGNDFIAIIKVWGKSLNNLYILLVSSEQFYAVSALWCNQRLALYEIKTALISTYFYAQTFYFIFLFHYCCLRS